MHKFAWMRQEVIDSVEGWPRVSDGLCERVMSMAVLSTSRPCHRAAPLFFSGESFWKSCILEKANNKMDR